MRTLRLLRVPAIATLLAAAAFHAGCHIPSPDDFAPKEEPDVAPIPDDPPPPAPGFVVVEVVPDVGAPRGLELVEVNGGGFKQGARVFFGGSEAPDVTVSGPGRIYAVTPPHTPAKVDVRVMNPDTTMAVLAGGFQYFAEIEIESIVPPEGPATGGIPVEVRGHGLGGADVLLFGGREALQTTVIDDRTLLAILPAHAAGRVDVHVVTAAGNGRLRQGYRFFEPPRVDGFFPLAAPAAGGGTLSLAGTGLTADAQVAVGGNWAEPLAVSPDGTRLVVRAPPGSPGPADICVTTEHGEVLLGGAFTYLLGGAAVLELLNVWPPSGPAVGGGEIVLVATGLPAAGVHVTIGDHTVVPSAVLPGQNVVLVTAPPGVAGSRVDVSLLSSGSERTLVDAYEYVPLLAVQSIEPVTGPQGGGTVVTIRGAGFGQDPEVFVGALPATHVEVLADGRLSATTPPGSPGYADVRVRAGVRTATLADGYTFVAGQTKVYAVVPEAGAIAGNTWVSVYGTDLPEHMAVHFGESPVQWTERLSPTEVVLRTPRAAEVSLVDVRASGGSFEALLPGAFTYFDPSARWGGTWGDPILGSLNVTVLDSATDDPVEGAVVVIGHDDPPRYKGYTDDRGQVTLSDRWLAGPLSVTAAKFGYSAQSIVRFDAENATLFIDNPTSSPGGGGDYLPPGDIVGTVEGQGKYVLLPAWPCRELGQEESGHCGPCRDAADCGDAAPECTIMAGQDPFCSSECTAHEDCPDGYVCAAAASGGGTLLAGTSRCVPSPGTSQARCYVSSASILSTPGAPDDDAIVDIAAGEDAFALSNVRLGEVAVYCLGGAVRMVGGEEVFKAYVMGIARHATVLPGLPEEPPAEGEPGSSPPLPPANPPTKVEITLDIPLSRTVSLIIGQQPLRPDGPHSTTVSAQLDLGSDGFVHLGSRAIGPGEEEVAFGGLPQSLAGPLYDAQYAFHASAETEGTEPYPTSDVLRAGLGTLDDGSYLFWDGASFARADSGYAGDVLDVCALAPDDVLASTRQGTILHFDGEQWWGQPVPQGPALNAVVRDLAGGVVAVGDRGRILRWNGVGWSADDSGDDRDLRDVVSLGASSAVAVGSYVVLEWDGLSWKQAQLGPPKDLHGVFGVGVSDVFAVGAHGIVLRRAAADKTWAAVAVPVHEHLYGVHGTGDGFIVAVGARGRILAGAGDGSFEAIQAPTSRTLRDVLCRAPGDVYAVGDAATVLHFDGLEWKVLTEELIEVSLRGIDGLPGSSQTGAGSLLDAGPIFAMGVHSVQLGPFLGVPTYTSPAGGALWNRRDVSFVAPPGGPDASFASYRIYGSSGLAWSIMAPGALGSFRLPDLNEIEGLPVVPNGQKRLIAYRVLHPSFDIDDYDSLVFRLMDWRAWSISSHDFDGPQPVATDTVPGT